MDRRAFLAGAAALLVAPLAAEAQRAGKVPRVGILSAGWPSPSPSPAWRAFQDGLRDLGWAEGRDLVLEPRFAEGQHDRLPALAQDLVRLNVDVIVTFGPFSIRPARDATRTIPIVMIGSSSDPVGDGFVTSLARPGGNITGVGTAAGMESTWKWLEFLKEVLPKASRVVVLLEAPQPPSFVRARADAARQLGLRLEESVIKVAKLESTMATISRRGVDAVYVPMGGFLYTHRDRVAALAIAHRLPTLGPISELPEAGGLLSYGQSLKDIFRRGATFVDKILKGAKPGDIPIEQAMKVELVINLKTAKALGLTIPPSVLARADQVIE
jgi:putative ABC transport system substrate-binding protein